MITKSKIFTSTKLNYNAMKKKTLILEVLSKSGKIEKIIKELKNSGIKELSMEETYIEGGVVSCVARIIPAKEDEIPVELFRELNKRLTEEDEKYLELIVRWEEHYYAI